MLSAIIPTHESERLLVRTLASLVPGATAGLVREVILADAGSKDETAQVGDIAGCRFLPLSGPRGARMKAAAGQARGEWLLFLKPGTVLESGWVAETEMFLASAAARTAAFRSMPGPDQSLLRESLSLLAAALFGGRHAGAGLLIARSFYGELGGHNAASDDPERDLARRIGRHRIVLLAARAALPADT